MRSSISYMIRKKLFKQALDTAEKQIFLAAMKETGDNQLQASKLLGVARGTLRDRLKKWGLLT